MNQIAARFAPHEALAETLLPLLDHTSDGSHDLSHILRVWTNVQTIAAKEGGDLRILAAATLLHDSVPVEKDASNRAQASRHSANLARRHLADMNWQKPDIERAAHAIEAHSFSARIPPTTQEAKILQDADRLDAIGLIGVARCFYVAGRLGRPLYDMTDPTAKTRALNDSRFTIDHFATKLLKLKDSFQTETGRALASDRHAQTSDFLAGFIEDISGGN